MQFTLLKTTSVHKTMNIFKELNQNYISQETKIISMETHNIFTMDLCIGFHVGKNLGAAPEKLHT